jgi:serine/threonine-protein kinase RsbW
MSIPSDPEYIERVEKKTEKIAKQAGLNENATDNLAIAVTEVVANAIVHGNRRDSSKKVTIEFILDERNIKVLISDEGTGFDPKDIKNPTTPENILKESGRGVFIVKALMDDVRFRFSDKGTVTTLIMKLK